MALGAKLGLQRQELIPGACNDQLLLPAVAGISRVEPHRLGVSRVPRLRPAVKVVVPNPMHDVMPFRVRILRAMTPLLGRMPIELIPIWLRLRGERREEGLGCHREVVGGEGKAFEASLADLGEWPPAYFRCEGYDCLEVDHVVDLLLVLAMEKGVDLYHSCV